MEIAGSFADQASMLHVWVRKALLVMGRERFGCVLELSEFRCFHGGLVIALRGRWCGGWVGERHVVMLSDLGLDEEGWRNRVIEQCVEPILADHAEWLMGVDLCGFADTPLGG